MSIESKQQYQRERDLEGEVTKQRQLVADLRAQVESLTARAEKAERRLGRAEEVVLMARQLTAYAWEDRLEDCEVSDSAKHDSRELSAAVWRYDQAAKS